MPPSSLVAPAEEWSRSWQALVGFDIGINVEKDDKEKFLFKSFCECRISKSKGHPSKQGSTWFIFSKEISY